MYYAKQIDETGNIIALHSMSVPFTDTDVFIPIDEAEYLELLAEIEKEIKKLEESNNEVVEEVMTEEVIEQEQNSN